MLPQSHVGARAAAHEGGSRVVVRVSDLTGVALTRQRLVSALHAVDGLVGQLRGDVLGVAKVGD